MIGNSPTWLTNASQLIEQIDGDLVQLREQLHQQPELSNQEFETTKILCRLLTSEDIPNQSMSEGPGLLSDLSSASAPLRRLALRADMDALPLQDAKDVSYRSQKSSVMHACGHDVHSTILCGTLLVLSRMMQKNLLPWPINLRGIFQPAEEVATGACYMIKQNAIRDIDHILALHVDPSRPVGRIGLRKGAFTAYCDLIDVHFVGQGGHGARPWETIDPINVATNWIQRIYQLVPPDQPNAETIVSFGTIHAGLSSNVIPDDVSVLGAIRCLHRDDRQLTLAEITRISEELEAQTGCEINWKLGFSAPSVINDDDLVELLRKSAVTAFEDDVVDEIPNPSMGGEDFSYYLEHLPGAMLRIGSAGEHIGHHPLHSPLFDIDKRTIALGVRMLVCATIMYFDPRQFEDGGP